MPQQKEIIRTLFRSVIDNILDGFFPRRCFGCKTYDTFLCDSCLARIPRRLPATFFIANSTHHTSPLDSLTSATFFRIPLVSLLIHAWKYQSIQELAYPLSSLLIEAAEHTSIPLPDIITAVPLHPKRLRERGFNQSELLAKELTTHINILIPVAVHLDLLQKIRYTKPQSKQQDREARLSNLTEAFILKSTYQNTLKGETVWLIDDVTTTGATLTECAKILKEHGVKEVHGFVIAH